MSDDGNCELCRARLGGGAQEAYGLMLCEACFAGDVVGRMKGRGIDLVAKEWVERSSARPGTTWIQTRVTGMVPLPTPPSATFSREEFGTQLRKFTGAIEEAVEVGDPFFDDTVLIETDTPELTRTALRSPGLQMAILQAVTEFGTIRFQPVPGGCRIAIASTEGVECNDPSVEGPRIVAIALHHLQRAMTA